jgi:hypothetical protein
MTFDINEVLAKMASAVKDTVADDWGAAQTVVNQFLQNKKDRLQLLAQLRISGDITQERFESRLEDEKLIAEAEFHAIAVITKATAQKAANAVIQVLEDAVSAVLKTVV